MAVKRNRNGIWRYRKMITLPNGSKSRISGTPSINTKRACEEAERAHIERALNPSIQRKEIRTLRAFGEEFMATYVRANNKPSERDSKRTILKAHLYPALGRKRLDQIGPSEIEALKANILDMKRSPKTVNNVLAVLRKVLRYAVEVGELDHAPRVKALRVAPQAFKFLEEHQYLALVQAASAEPDWCTAILLAGDAGLRRGELLALSWQDVDLRANALTVRRSRWNNQLGSPKGHRARTVPMTRRLRSALGACEHQRGEWVLADGEGAPLTVEAMRWNLPRFCEKAELDPIGWHALRHTFCSHLAIKGAPARAIQELAGHQDLATTLRYMHMAPSVLADAVSLLEKESSWQQSGKTKRAPEIPVLFQSLS